MGFYGMNLKFKKEIIIATNDAGGAEVLAAYVLANQKHFDFICYTSGPAVKIMERNGIVWSKAPEKRRLIAGILRKHRNAKLVLTGTGWMTSIEVDFLVEAKRLGLRTAALIDHFVNYRERFGFPKKDWRENIPDQIWVTDRTAFKMAEKLFPSIRIKQIPNYYLLDIVREYDKLKRKKSEGRSILFLSEPVGRATNTSGVKSAHHVSEFRALRDILSIVGALKRPVPVIIRFHPSEKKGKYDDIIEKYSNTIKITKSANRKIINDIAKAKLVIGMTSMSLIASLACNKKTISYVATDNKGGIVPAKNLINVKTYSELCSSIRTFISQ
ncbi:MAG: hypothetical protein Q7S09_03465 [bacterium]|nr:hypothetical protein [bacterium]